MQAGSGPRTVLRVHLDGDEASESEVARASRPDVEEDFHFAALPNGRVAYSDTTAYLIKVTDPAGNVDRVLVRSLHSAKLGRPHRQGLPQIPRDKHR